MIDPMSEASGNEPARPEASLDVQMDPRPLDNVTTAAQDMASSLDVSLVQSQRIHKLNDYWLARAKGRCRRGRRSIRSTCVSCFPT